MSLNEVTVPVLTGTRGRLKRKKITGVNRQNGLCTLVEMPCHCRDKQLYFRHFKELSVILPSLMVTEKRLRQIAIATFPPEQWSTLELLTVVWRGQQVDAWRIFYADTYLQPDRAVPLIDTHTLSRMLQQRKSFWARLTFFSAIDFTFSL